MARLDPSSKIPDIIVEESSRLDHIIKDFLDFAKPKVADLRPCAVEDIIEKNLAFISPKAREDNIRIIKNFQNNLPQIMADPTLLYQAFLNIFLNAFQAMDSGELTISTQYEAGRVCIRFTDTGAGIDPEILKKIWTPFFTTKETGTGLGLGIIKNIIEAHHGSVEISNISHGGTCVSIMLPAAETTPKESNQWKIY